MKHSRQPRWNRAGIFVLVSLCAGTATTPVAQAKVGKDTATVQVEVDSQSDADEANVLVNGKTIGPVPLTLSLQPGRYLIEVSKPGRQIWRKWLDVAAGDKAVLRASLPPAAGSGDDRAREGTLLVACDVLSARVFVDGTSAGAVPALVKGLKPGKHSVEVRAEGRRSRTDATVHAGKLTKLSLSLGRAAAAPSPSEEPSDTVEGTPAEEPAPAPDDSKQTPPGSGGAPSTAHATEAAVTLRVDTEPHGAEVLVDGVVRGVAPLSIEGLAPGAHEVEARSDGMSSATKTIVLEPGASPQLSLRLEREPSASPSAPMTAMLPDAPGAGGKTGELVVRSAKPGAIVYVNGERLGETPLRRRLLVGPHVVSVRRAGHEDFLAMADVRAATPANLDVALKPRRSSDEGDRGPDDAGSVVEGRGDGAPPATYVSADALDARPADIGLMGTYSARLVSPRYVTADFSTGFPYLAEIGLTTGIADFGSLGFDGGVDFRTYGAMTEFGLRGRLRVLNKGPWALATSLSFGGGGGPKGRNTFYFESGAVASVLIANWMSLSLRSAFSAYTDRHCPATPNPNELDVCRQSPADGSTDSARGRYSGIRLTFGAIAELPLADWINVFGGLEMAPFQGNREAFSDPFASIMPESDPGLYGRIGLTIKR